MSMYFVQLLRQTGVRYHATPTPETAGLGSPAAPLNIHQRTPAEPTQSQSDTEVSAEDGVQDSFEDYQRREYPSSSDDLQKDTPGMIMQPVIPRTTGALDKGQTKFDPASLESRDIIERTNANSIDSQWSATQFGDEISHRGQLWHPTLKQVREWVAGTPTGNETGNNQYISPQDENRNKTASLAVEQSRVGKERERSGMMFRQPVAPKSQGRNRPIGTVGQNAVHKVYPELATSSQRRIEPERQEFHLSISSLNVTVEEPSNQIQSRELPQARSRQKPATENSRSRLSRHYLRLR